MMRTPGSDKKAGFASETRRNRCDLERGLHTKCVGIHNPSAATRINKRPDGSFFYSVRRGGEGHPDGGPTRRQKADGSMPVPRSFNEGGFAQGNEA